METLNVCQCNIILPLTLASFTTIRETRQIYGGYQLGRECDNNILNKISKSIFLFHSHRIKRVYQDVSTCSFMYWHSNWFQESFQFQSTVIMTPIFFRGTVKKVLIWLVTHALHDSFRCQTDSYAPEFKALIENLLHINFLKFWRNYLHVYLEIPACVVLIQTMPIYYALHTRYMLYK